MTDQNIVSPTEELTYCAVHPDRETSLRCITCNRYMCVDCAVRTPVGYRCRECSRQQQDKFFTATSNDDIVIFGVCAVLTAIAAAILGRVGFGIWISLILGLPIGGLIGEAALRATGRRRGRQSHVVAAAGAVIGGIVGNVLAIYLQYNNMMSQIAARSGLDSSQVPSLSLDTILSASLSDIGSLLLIGLIAFAVYGRYKMKL
jgi:hypothetical protein